MKIELQSCSRIYRLHINGLTEIVTRGCLLYAIRNYSLLFYPILPTGKVYAESVTCMQHRGIRQPAEGLRPQAETQPIDSSRNLFTSATYHMISQNGFPCFAEAHDHITFTCAFDILRYWQWDENSLTA